MWLVSCECSVQWAMHVCVCAHVYTSVVCVVACVCVSSVLSARHLILLCVLPLTSHINPFQSL